MQQACKVENKLATNKNHKAISSFEIKLILAKFLIA